MWKAVEIAVIVTGWVLILFVNGLVNWENWFIVFVNYVVGILVGIGLCRSLDDV